MYSILLSYQDRLSGLHAAAQQLRVGQIIAMAVLVLMISICFALTYLSIAKNNVRLSIALFPLSISALATKVYLNRRSDLLRTLRLTCFYEQGISRMEGTWVGRGQSGSEFTTPDHEFAHDLSVFGRGSLFELLCTCRTQVGRKTLAAYLTSSVSAEEILKRQEAIKELKANIALREHLALLGKYAFQQSSWAPVTEWLEEPTLPSPYLVRIVSLLCSASLGLLTLLAWDHALAWNVVVPWIGLLLGCNSAFGIYYRKRVVASAPSIRSLGEELNVLRNGLGLMQKEEFRSILLQNLQTGSLRGRSLVRIRTLERLAQAFVERDKEWFYVASRTLLVGTQFLLAVEAWKQKYGADLLKSLSIWGEFEALVALAGYAYEHPDTTFPQISTSKSTFEAKGIRNPLLTTGRCVRNDIALNEQTRFYLISGSNMAGKSTMLRTIGLNTVLALAGAPVCAEQMIVSRLQICTSLTIQDSLLDGKSKFLAEMERIKLALTVSRRDVSLLFLIDEILNGTNSKDRRTATELILRALVEQGAVGALSTHDMTLTEIAEFEGLHGKNMHMQSADETDPLKFDYILKPGIATQTNALAIARLAGLSV
jgi:hypothetical protein